MNPAADSNRPPVIDRATLLEELGGDEDLLKEIAGLFLETGPGQLQGVRDAAAAGDALALSRHAHTLKGALAQLHAETAAAAARDVEEPARQGQAATAVAAVPKLETEVAAVQRELEALLKGA
ncbi:MAG: Hpt domain-containing protein [Verrucomicrobia bacterium]|nr:Hpt domain-containing protein [Verrucomicrobiota bacterium]